MRQILWKLAGFVSLGFAYIGVITPGIPWSIFVVFSAYAFAKGSPMMHAWIYNHPQFGPFLSNWTTKKIFPLRAKWFMLLTMSSSLAIMYFTIPLSGVIYSSVFMALVAVWAWKYPSTVEEHERRCREGKKIGWIK